MAVIWAMRGLVAASGELDPQAWRRFLDIHLAGLRAAPPGGQAESHAEAGTRADRPAG
jgi:hypothetical protein